jgi:hypothetical protein
VDAAVWFVNVPPLPTKVHVLKAGSQPRMLLGGGGTFRSQGLTAGSWITGNRPLKRILRA